MGLHVTTHWLADLGRHKHFPNIGVVDHFWEWVSDKNLVMVWRKNRFRVISDQIGLNPNVRLMETA